MITPEITKKMSINKFFFMILFIDFFCIDSFIIIECGSCN